MWRPAHGATNRPGPCRPASGYGRAFGRPGPRADDLLGEATPVGALDPAAFGTRAEAPVPGHSVIADSSSARPGAPGPVPATCAAISLVRSPWSLTLPSMNACIPACGLPLMKISRAVA